MAYKATPRRAVVADVLPRRDSPPANPPAPVTELGDLLDRCASNRRCLDRLNGALAALLDRLHGTAQGTAQDGSGAELKAPAGGVLAGISGEITAIDVGLDLLEVYVAKLVELA
jgi:hypothetical protein